LRELTAKPANRSPWSLSFAHYALDLSSRWGKYTPLYTDFEEIKYLTKTYNNYWVYGPSRQYFKFLCNF